MARDFTGGAYLTRATSVASTMPYSAFCRFKLNSLTGNSYLMGSGDTATNVHYWTILVLATSGFVRATQIGGGAGASAQTTAAAGTTAWHSAAAVFTSATSRTIYLDGANAVTNTTSITPAGLDNTTVGNLVIFAGAQTCTSQIAESAVWDAALTAAEVASLHAGTSPLLIRPGNLVAYWPIVGNNSPEIDPVGGFDLTLVATPAKVAHPRVFYPKRKHILHIPAAAGGTIIGPLIGRNHLGGSGPLISGRLVQ